ncbi:hypothetical protein PBI_AN9_75 [Mycobacterium phage AN9]|nr:hypothetical protein PBI_VC3_74 [Mycobacterium phage VC3]QJD52537.1 hypothetical protein PBI_ANI8_75 [Mycobacterium phage ANI8]QJD52629.1 hypothetical protein PBI_AN9_75 [Mycobacterium phage AN9]BBC43629.1 hypothetical protein [Mycobacterium phage C3]
MSEYRKTIELDASSEYTFVELGPIEDMPKWHHAAQPSRWPFPTPEAALQFARGESERHQREYVIIAYPDGRRWNGKEWVS